MAYSKSTDFQNLPKPEPRSFRRAIFVATTSTFLFCTALVIIKMGVLEKLFAKWEFFNIREVQVTARWPLTESEVKSWLPNLEKSSLLLLSPRDLVVRLEGKPWVKEVILKKEFPSRLLLDVESKIAEGVAVFKGIPTFVDGEGKPIAKATPTLLQVLDLPVLSVEKESVPSHQDLVRAIEIISILRTQMDAKFPVSEIVLSPSNFFKVFFSSPRVEVTMSLENWESQLVYLRALLRNPPSQIAQPWKINLVLPKKAVVSSSLSH